MRHSNWWLPSSLKTYEGSSNTRLSTQRPRVVRPATGYTAMLEPSNIAVCQLIECAVDEQNSIFYKISFISMKLKKLKFFGIYVPALSIFISTIKYQWNHNITNSSSNCSWWAFAAQSKFRPVDDGRGARLSASHALTETWSLIISRVERLKTMLSENQCPGAISDK